MSLITCDSCLRSFDRSVERRPAGENLFDVGFACPHCFTWFHGFWDSPRLAYERTELERLRDKAKGNVTITKVYNKRLKRCNKLFDRLQEQQAEV